ncbi:MAG: CoA-binding protein [Acidobacteriota bacterium]
MEKIVENIALIGASANKSKYGNIILKDLRSKGYTVFPVHPALKEIEGIKVYNSVDELNVLPDLFVFVIPSSLGFDITKKLYEKGHRKFWYQPGAQSVEISDFLEKDNSVKFSTISCIMVNTEMQGDLVF